MESVYFETCNNGSCPDKAVIAGQEKNGNNVYVARAEISGELTIGKMVREAGGAFIPWGGKENSAFTYEVLVNAEDKELVWVPSRFGAVPVGALIGGTCKSGEPQYVGRADHDGIWVPGKMIASHGGVLYPYGGKENGSTIFEVLCAKAVTVPRQ